MRIAIEIVLCSAAFIAGLWCRARVDHLASFKAGFHVGLGSRPLLPAGPAYADPIALMDQGVIPSDAGNDNARQG